MFPHVKHFHVAAFVLSYTVLVTTELARADCSARLGR